MANQLYDSGREGILDGTIDMTAGTVKAALVRGYTFSAAHEDLADVTGAGGSIVGTATALSSKDYSDGVFDAADVVYSAVAAGAAIDNVVIFNDTGTASTSRVIVYIDTATGLPVTPNGGDITVQWDSGSNKIFKL